jgi:hypothetical protein
MAPQAKEECGRYADLINLLGGFIELAMRIRGKFVMQMGV